jgi:antitoxin Phd
MHVWPVQDAKARFSEFLEACIAEGPQMVTKRGAEAAVLVAVLVPVSVWKRMQVTARPRLKDLLLTGDARMDIPLPKRGRTRRRPADGN